MLDLDPDEEEVNLAHQAVLQMELGVGVLKLNVQALRIKGGGGGGRVWKNG